MHRDSRFLHFVHTACRSRVLEFLDTRQRRPDTQVA
jgi:hypothetical protein